MKHRSSLDTTRVRIANISAEEIENDFEMKKAICLCFSSRCVSFCHIRWLKGAEKPHLGAVFTMKSTEIRLAIVFTLVIRIQIIQTLIHYTVLYSSTASKDSCSLDADKTHTTTARTMEQEENQVSREVPI